MPSIKGSTAYEVARGSVRWAQALELWVQQMEGSPGEDRFAQREVCAGLLVIDELRPRIAALRRPADMNAIGGEASDQAKTAEEDEPGAPVTRAAVDAAVNEARGSVTVLVGEERERTLAFLDSVAASSDAMTKANRGSGQHAQAPQKPRGKRS